MKNDTYNGTLNNFIFKLFYKIRICSLHIKPFQVSNHAALESPDAFESAGAHQDLVSLFSVETWLQATIAWTMSFEKLVKQTEITELFKKSTCCIKLGRQPGDLEIGDGTEHRSWR